MANSEIDRLLDEVIRIMESYKISDEDAKIALEKLNYILNLDPINEDALMWKALLYQSQEEYTQAISIYEQVLAINPDNKIVKDSIKDCKEFAKISKHQKTNEIEIPDFLKKDYDKGSAKDSLWTKIPCELIFAVKIVILLLMLYSVF